MKEQQNNKFSLKKLTIAKINVNSMDKIKGGSSIPTSDADLSYCVIEP